MAAKSLIIGAVLVLVLFVSGIFLVFNSLSPLEKKNVVLNDTFSVAPESYQNRTAIITSDGQYVASFVVTGGTINFSWVPTVELWLDGQFKPNWLETDETEAGFSFSFEQGFGKTYLYLVFLNNGTSTKDVRLEVFKAWTEMNYVGLLGGAALIICGAIIAVVLKYRRKTPIPTEESGQPQ